MLLKQQNKQIFDFILLERILNALLKQVIMMVEDWEKFEINFKVQESKTSS